MNVIFFFENFQNLMEISKMERKILKMFVVFHIIVFYIVPDDSEYNKKNTCDRQWMC